MIRAFIAVELSQELRAAIGAAQAGLKDQLGKELRRTAPESRIQWVKPESIHVTLKFLGGTDEGLLGEIDAAMQLVSRQHAAFDVEVGGFGAFPDLRAPRVLWIGLSGEVGRLADLAHELDSVLQELGFAPETRPFRPHLTVARVKERGREVGRALAGGGLLQEHHTLGKLSVSAISLMKSDLKPSGAVYTRLLEAKLPGVMSNE